MFKPGTTNLGVAEIQYFDYMLYALQTLSDDLASLHWRTKGAQAAPVIIEDNCFIGSRSIVVEGARIEKEAVLGANVVITNSTRIIDVSGKEPVEVLIVAVQETAGSALYGMLDVLLAAGNIWQTLVRSGSEQALFRVRIVAPTAESFTCGNSIRGYHHGLQSRTADLVYGGCTNGVG